MPHPIGFGFGFRFGFEVVSSCQTRRGAACLPYRVGLRVLSWQRAWVDSLRVAFALIALATLSGCGTLPSPVDRLASMSLGPSASGNLAAIARASTPSAELSGFRLLPLGLFSLEARLQLAQRARHSLDVQYYVIEDDSSGHLFLRQIRNAAQRGVRVRLLVDDIHTAKTDPILRALAAHPNVEVRLFNPFCCARTSLVTRLGASLFDLRRLNRRMHNKLLIADGLTAVVGGRNVADEYFMRNGLQNFIDMDAFIMGAVVPDLAAIFDRYWNSNLAYPVQSMVIDERPAETLLQEFERRTEADKTPLLLPSVDVLGYGPLSEELDAGRVGLVWAPARAFADPPNKLDPMSVQEAALDNVSRDVRMKIWGAQSQLILTSPYLVPGKAGIAEFESLGRRKVKMVVLTNSLAANDNPVVHTGYARYRNRLLAAGVDLYEMSPARIRRTERLGIFGSSLGRLHAKTAVIDNTTVFIGSMNLDPRSETQNTELGIFIESPQLAKELLRIVNISKLQSAYRLRLNPDGGGLQWLTMDDDNEVILDVEPESSLWQRLYNVIISPLVPEQLL